MNKERYFLGCLTHLVLAISLTHLLRPVASSLPGGSQRTPLVRQKRYLGAAMGVRDNNCDNAKDHLDVDWPGFNFTEFTCPEKYYWTVDKTVTPIYYQIPNLDPTKDTVYHYCLNETISYPDVPPLRGDHRPNWAIFGEYLYLPPQRWLHNLEHASTILLYHPCADPREVAKLRGVVRSCLYRHIITPYNKLSRERPIALVNWGAKIEMNEVDVQAAAHFIKVHAHKAPEDLYKQGQYSLYLVDKSKAPSGSDIMDSNVCPWTASPTPRRWGGVTNTAPYPYYYVNGKK